MSFIFFCTSIPQKKETKRSEQQNEKMLKMNIGTETERGSQHLRWELIWSPVHSETISRPGLENGTNREICMKLLFYNRNIYCHCRNGVVSFLPYIFSTALSSHIVCISIPILTEISYALNSSPLSQPKPPVPHRKKTWCMHKYICVFVFLCLCVQCVLI